MADHPVVRPHAPRGDVPGAMQDLERLDLLVAGAPHREDELLGLDRGRHVAAGHAAGVQHAVDRPEERPRFG